LVEVAHVHRDPALDLPAFVSRAGAPEAEVRRAVRELGYGHFRSFLNAHRVADARAMLADPASADLKLAAVAWDAGFASLASFNRAFKHVEGRAPSEFRAERLAAPGAESSSEPAPLPKPGN
jgi:AraC-like DNA-binding protein